MHAVIYAIKVRCETFTLKFVNYGKQKLQRKRTHSMWFHFQTPQSTDTQSASSTLPLSLLMFISPKFSHQCNWTNMFLVIDCSRVGTQSWRAVTRGGWLRNTMFYFFVYALENRVPLSGTYLDMFLKRRQYFCALLWWKFAWSLDIASYFMHQFWCKKCRNHGIYLFVCVNQHIPTINFFLIFWHISSNVHPDSLKYTLNMLSHCLCPSNSLSPRFINPLLHSSCACWPLVSIRKRPQRSHRTRPALYNTAEVSMFLHVRSKGWLWVWLSV